MADELEDAESSDEKGWWWTDAVEKAERIIKEIEIPWDQLHLEEDDITNPNLMILSEKLARTSYYTVQVNNHLTRLVAVQMATKEALEHAVGRILATGDDINGVKPKPSIEARRAAIISKHEKLKRAKVECMESGSIIKALEITRESLDLCWRTTSRVMSARQTEPIDR